MIINPARPAGLLLTLLSIFVTRSWSLISVPEVCSVTGESFLRLRGAGAGGGCDDQVAEAIVTLRGGCHCKKVRFEIDSLPKLVVLDCTCSICRMRRNTHFIVKSRKFRLTSGGEGDQISTYTFNTGVAKHTLVLTNAVREEYKNCTNCTPGRYPVPGTYQKRIFAYAYNL